MRGPERIFGPRLNRDLKLRHFTFRRNHDRVAPWPITQSARSFDGRQLGRQAEDQLSANEFVFRFFGYWTKLTPEEHAKIRTI
jgi:hypothetical protein